MASHQTQSRSFALWDSANPDEQEIVSRSAKYKDLLNNRLDELTDLVRLPDMWPTLKALSVIDQRAKDRIWENGIPAEAIERLVRNLETGKTWRLHGFIRALYKTDQSHIIELLSLKVADYDDTPVQYRPQPQKIIQLSDSVKEERDTSRDNLTGTAGRGGKEIPLWDRNHPNGQYVLIIKRPDLENKLDGALPSLKKLVRPGDLWAYLKKYGVMDDNEIEKCKTAGVKGLQVEAIVEFLKQDVLWKLQAFFRSLAQIKQDYAIDVVLGNGAKEAYNKNLLETDGTTIASTD